MNSYAVLGIAPDATDDEVRLAYKHRALECHPDRHAKDKDIATQNFIELHAAYRAILSERTRKAAMSRTSEPTRPPAKSTERQQPGTKNDPKPPKAPPPSSSSTHSFKSNTSPTSSTPSSTPSSSPFTTPSSSPYSTPASSPASSTASLPDEKDSSPKRSARCEDAEDEDHHSSTSRGSSTDHTAKPPPDPGSSREAPPSPKPPRAKLRKQPPRAKPDSSTLPSSTPSNDYECRDYRSGPTYTASATDTCNTHSNTDSNAHSDTSKHHKLQEIELKEYYNSFPSLKDYPRVDLAPEWVYPLQLTLEDIFRGKRLCYRIRRRYLSGKTKAVVLDVDVPVGCRSGTKIVFRDAGHERRDGTRQDLVFIVQEVRHARFVRGYEWDSNGGGGSDVGKDDKDDKKHRKDREHSNDSSGRKSRKSRKSHEYGEDDLVMEVRLPWVERLKEEIAKVVVSGVDGKELVFEVDCRSGKCGSSREENEMVKMTGTFIVEGAGMPVKSDIRGGSGKGTGAAVGANGAGQRGRLIIRWEIFIPASSSSKWESFKQMFKFGK